jgi:site-specific DNA recombinase
MSGSMRAALYTRVSSEEQVEGFSLDAQRRALEEFCRAKGWTIVDFYSDEGRSARGVDLAKRPQFMRLMQDVQARKCDVVVVHKLDRFARNIGVIFNQFEVLSKHGVAFASVTEQGYDFTLPAGKMMLALLASFAQYYSDNLSTETKKGKAERKAQGRYNGLLPFGVKKNADGSPVPDPKTYPGLLLAYQWCAEGRSDREIALALNERGYRSTGNRGNNPFTKDGVRPILRNRFYLGELPDGRGGWQHGAHEALLDDSLFAAAQVARERNLTAPSTVKVTTAARTYSLSGLVRCDHCGGRLHFNMSKAGRPRVYCYQQQQAARCAQRSTFLDCYEAQIAEHLALFTLPADYRRQILALHAAERRDGDDREARRTQLEGRLARIKELFGWGDMEREVYRVERDRLQQELASLRDDDSAGTIIEAVAILLADIKAAWCDATQEQRNGLARLLFREVRIRDREVVALVPAPEFVPFFRIAGCEDLSTEDHVTDKKEDSPDSRGCPGTLSGGSDGGQIRAFTRFLPCPHPNALPGVLSSRHAA